MSGHEGSRFIWDAEKERLNILKHGVNFTMAMLVFGDPDVKLFIDERHSGHEDRFFAIGKVAGNILTVRFTYREDKVRIFGAGYWRRGKKAYDEKD